MRTPGRCHVCRCTHFYPCPGTCGWANRDQTLCTECVAIARAFRRLTCHPQSMLRAFFRGYTAGADDERADVDAVVVTPPRNPYPGRPRARYWDLGFGAGMQAKVRAA